MQPSGFTQRTAEAALSTARKGYPRVDEIVNRQDGSFPWTLRLSAQHWS
jgi:hypothetical protein